MEVVRFAPVSDWLTLSAVLPARFAGPPALTLSFPPAPPFPPSRSRLALFFRFELPFRRLRLRSRLRPRFFRFFDPFIDFFFRSRLRLLDLFFRAFLRSLWLP